MVLLVKKYINNEKYNIIYIYKNNITNKYKNKLIILNNVNNYKNETIKTLINKDKKIYIHVFINTILIV